MSKPVIEEGGRLAGAATMLLSAIALIFLLPFVASLVTWERTSTALLPLRLFVLGVCPLVSALALYTARRGKPETRVNLVLGIGATVCAIYVGELLIPFALQLRTLASVESTLDTPIDRRDKVEVLLEARADGIDAVTSVEPKGLMRFDSAGVAHSRLSDQGAELQPVGGLSRRHTVVCNEGGTWVTYESDRYGMNNPDSVWAFDAIDIATIGDSFTNGWCVPTEQHFTQLIRSRYARMVNVAQSGNGPILNYAALVEYVAARQPGTVLWFHYEGNDFEDLAVEVRSPLLRGYLDGTTHQRLAERQDAIDEAISAYIESELDRWRDFGRLAIERPAIHFDLGTLTSLIKLDNLRTLSGMVYTASYDPDYDTFARVLAEANRAVGDWGGTLHLVYLPSWHRYRRSDLAERYDAARERVIAEAERLGMPVVDVASAFVTDPDPLSFFIPIEGGIYGHYNERGNRVAATAVIEGLRD